jgi:esterase/lipase superfamily enzyme
MVRYPISASRHRATRRAFLVGGGSLVLGGCFGFAGAGTPGDDPYASMVSEPTLLVATTRRPATPPGERPFFGPERGTGLTFARARMTPPATGLTARVTNVVSGGWRVASVDDVTSREAADAFTRAALGKDVLLYVHGYRETFETAATSAAELADGISFRGAPGLFTWPSAGATLDYAYDRESAMWSRDALEDLLLTLAQSPSGGRVHIVAHSMGSLLTLETLRMLRGSGGDRAMARIGAVVLAAPDVDIDQFEQAVNRLGPDAPRITVIVSSRDRALLASQRIAGGVARAGAAERERLTAMGVRVADASDFGRGILNHDLFLSNEEVRRVVQRAIERAG